MPALICTREGREKCVKARLPVVNSRQICERFVLRRSHVLNSRRRPASPAQRDRNGLPALTWGEVDLKLGCESGTFTGSRIARSMCRRRRRGVAVFSVVRNSPSDTRNRGLHSRAEIRGNLRRFQRVPQPEGRRYCRPILRGRRARSRSRAPAAPSRWSRKVTRTGVKRKIKSLKYELSCLDASRTLRESEMPSFLKPWSRTARRT